MVAAEKPGKYPTRQEVVEELKRTADMGFPIAGMSLVGYMRNMISVVCMGRLGSLELAGGAMAIGFTNITGYSVLSGLATGMEPLCSQAFGSRNLSVVSLTLQRTIVMLLMASLPIAMLWLYLEPLMLALRQEPGITLIAAEYCRFALPDLVANSLLHPFRIYLRSRGTTWPLMWAAMLGIVLHLPLTLFFVSTLSLGVRGIAVSTFLTNFATLLLLICYAYWTGNGETEEHLGAPLVSAPEPAGGKQWSMLLRLAIPSCAAVCLEWWWYELMTLAAGYLENPRAALATAAIVIQTTALMYTLPAALSASVSTRVGNELGAGRPGRARLAAVVAIGLALVSSLFGLLWTTLGRKPWGKLFTEDDDVLRLTMTVLPIVGLCELANCPQTTSCGILRGTARPSIGAAINFCSFYLVGAPVALLLAFVWNMGFTGLCYGLLSAQISCAVSILAVIYNTDWERESHKARDLVGDAAELDPDPALKCEEGGAAYAHK